MSISNLSPQPYDVILLQRDSTNSYWGEVHISGSNLIFYVDSMGYVNADYSSSFYNAFPPPGATSSNLITGSLVPITSSYAISSSYALTQSYTQFQIAFLTSSLSSSWASQSLSSSYAQTASFALNAGGGTGTFLFTASLYYITSSWALSSSVSLQSISSSYAQTASFALNAGGGTNLITGSLVPITSSQSISSSYALTASFALNAAGSTTTNYHHSLLLMGG